MAGNNQIVNKVSYNTFIQLNIQNLEAHLTELKCYLFHNFPLCVCLCETRLKKQHKLKIPGYYVIRCDRETGAGGGLAILLKHRTQHEKVDIDLYHNGVLEIQCIRIKFKTKWLKILNIYNPCKDLTFEELYYYLTIIGPHSLMIGDFNAKHQYWDPLIAWNRANASGKALADILLESQIHFLLTPTGLSTRQDPYHGTLSTLDLAIGAGVCSDPLSVTAGPDMGSDHLPIIIEFGKPCKPDKIYHRPKWIIKNNKLEQWSADLQNKSILRGDDLNEALSNFTNSIIEHSLEYFKLSSSSNTKLPRTPWWNEECQKAVENRRAAKVLAHRFPTIVNLINYRRMSAIARHTTKNAKTSSWREFASSMNSHTPIAQVWGTFKAIAGSAQPPSYPFSGEDGNPLSEAEAANKLAEHFYNVFNSAAAVSDEYADVFNLSLTDQCADGINSLVTLGELKEAIHGIKPNTAYGQDQIHNLFITNLPPRHLPALLSVMNKSWRTADVPKEWRQALMVVLYLVPKPGKDPKLPASYRPISILCISKLME